LGENKAPTSENAARSDDKKEDPPMKTFVTLYNFTDQGQRGIKETVKRAEAARAAAAQSGVRIKEILWLQGPYDLIVIAESPDDAAANAFSINVLKAGNLRGQTLRAFNATEMTAILEKVV
jgi:uncharacterized protein with GYD domain